MSRILLAIILKGVLADSFETHTPQKPRRDDPVGIDVVEQQRHTRARHLFNTSHASCPTLGSPPHSPE
jgi:hypothetical protein